MEQITMTFDEFKNLDYAGRVKLKEQNPDLYRDYSEMFLDGRKTAEKWAKLERFGADYDPNEIPHNPDNDEGQIPDQKDINGVFDVEDFIRMTYQERLKLKNDYPEEYNRLKSAIDRMKM